MAIRLIPQAGGVRFAVKVVPGASRERIVGPLGEALKIAVKKPASGGEANAAVVALLAGRLGVPASSVHITRGHGNPRKEIFVEGVTVEHVLARIDDHPTR